MQWKIADPINDGVVPALLLNTCRKSVVQRSRELIGTKSYLVQTSFEFYQPLINQTKSEGRNNIALDTL